MLDMFNESSLPATVMTPRRRKALAIKATIGLTGATLGLLFLQAPLYLWLILWLAGLVSYGIVLTVPSVPGLEGLDPDAELLEWQYRRAKNYIKELDRTDFAALQESTDEPTKPL